LCLYFFQFFNLFATCLQVVTPQRGNNFHEIFIVFSGLAKLTLVVGFLFSGYFRVFSPGLVNVLQLPGRRASTACILSYLGA